MRRTSAAVPLELSGAARPGAERPVEAIGDPVEALRRQLAGTTAREHVVLDFLADDLREARQTLSALQAYLAGIESTLGGADLSQQRLLALSVGRGPVERIDYLAEVLASLRRRMAQVAARM